MRIVYALVDYDNVCTAVSPEVRAEDVALNLNELLGALAIRTANLIPDSRELVVRFYGGWFDRTGRITARGSWVVNQLPSFRTRIHALQVRPTLAASLVAYPEVDLVGTYRPDLGGQKMVDTMITVDAIALAGREEQLMIVSDDEDFAPAAIASGRVATRRRMVTWLRRRRAAGDAPNDGVLQDRLAITITTC